MGILEGTQAQREQRRTETFPELQHSRSGGHLRGDGLSWPQSHQKGRTIHTQRSGEETRRPELGDKNGEQSAPQNTAPFRWTAAWQFDVQEQWPGVDPAQGPQLQAEIHEGRQLTCVDGLPCFLTNRLALGPLNRLGHVPHSIPARHRHDERRQEMLAQRVGHAVQIAKSTSSLVQRPYVFCRVWQRVDSDRRSA